MKRLLFSLACSIVVPALTHAQGPSSFSATGTSAACVICNGTSNPACQNTMGNGNFVGGTTLTSLTANISTPNGSGNNATLDIRPDLVTGLFIDPKISTTIPQTTGEVGIQVCVTVDGSGTHVKPASCVIYDEHFLQPSSQLFSQLTECTAAPTGSTCSSNSPSCTSGACTLGNIGTCTQSPATICTSNAQCTAAGDSCDFAGQCTAVNPNCNLESILSTLSVHSFDYLVSMPGPGRHTVTASWSVVDQTGNTSSSDVAACVGPGVLTVTQYTLNNGTLTFGSL